jgi:hypothetical protein
MPITTVTSAWQREAGMNRDRPAAFVTGPDVIVGLN